MIHSFSSATSHFCIQVGGNADQTGCKKAGAERIYLTSGRRMMHMHLMDNMQKIETRSGHIIKTENGGNKDTEIVYFDYVITCSLTTKRRQQRTRRKESK